MGLKDSITLLDIKNQVGCEKVFTHYFGKFNLTSSYNSTLRKDKKRSTGFYLNKQGFIIYNDFSTSEKYNCVSYVGKKLRLSYNEAIDEIARTFHITEGGGEGFEPIPIIKEKKKSVFSVYTRAFTNKDLAWWGAYEITKKELIENNIYSVARLDVGKHSFITRRGQLKFAYLFRQEENGYFKIYAPHDENKWFFNAALNLVFGLERLQFKSDTLIITKSVKDYIVLKKVFPDVIALQNESLSAVAKETMIFLKSKYKKIILFFDMDRAGVKSTNQFRREYGVMIFFIGNKNINIWQNFIKAREVKVKDPSDFVKQYGLEAFKKYLRSYKLIK